MTAPASTVAWVSLEDAKQLALEEQNRTLRLYGWLVAIGISTMSEDMKVVRALIKRALRSLETGERPDGRGGAL